MVWVTRLGFGQAQIAGGVELRHQQHGAAEGQRREEHHQRGVGVQRRGQQGDRVRPVAVARPARDMGPAHAVRLHDALGRAGGAGRIDDVEGQPGSTATGAGWLPGAASQSSSGWPAADPSSATRGTAPQSGIAHRLGRAGVGEQHPRARVGSMRAKASGVLPGASGATTTPARSAPR
jgi:hypothetical protein